MYWRKLLMIILISCAAFLQLNCSAKGKKAACLASCAVLQLGSNYGCEKINQEKFPAEYKLCLDGKPVLQPACVAICVDIPDDEEQTETPTS